MTVEDGTAVLLPLLAVAGLVVAWRYYRHAATEGLRASLAFVMAWCVIGGLMAVEHAADRDWGKAGDAWTRQRMCETFQVWCDDLPTPVPVQELIDRFFDKNELGAPPWQSGTSTPNRN